MTERVKPDGIIDGVWIGPDEYIDLDNDDRIEVADMGGGRRWVATLGPEHGFRRSTILRVIDEEINTEVECLRIARDMKESRICNDTLERISAIRALRARFEEGDE